MKERRKKRIADSHNQVPRFEEISMENKVAFETKGIDWVNDPK